MNDAEFRAYAAAEGYDEPEARSQPPGKFFDTHTHERDLIVLIQEGTFTVDYGDRKDEFGPGDMCYVAPKVDHTDQAGPEGASYLLAWR
jgi:mannose-6-phosphate isomerase-like protein (cupin superfamily)